MLHCLRTDETEEAVSAIEMVSESIMMVEADIYRWKWALVALHSAVQGFMVLALRGGNGLAVLRDDVASAWLGAHEMNAPYPEDRLDTYDNLYRKVKSDCMLMYTHSKKFVPVGSQSSSIKGLKHLRNQLIHFVPRGWLLECSGLPALFSDCLDLIDFLGWECGNVIWLQHPLESRAKAAIVSTRSAIFRLRQIYGG
jgi:hypothetical protein